MLKELDRKERVSKLEALEKADEKKRFSMYQDYYDGEHFVKLSYHISDYGKNQQYDVATRSGSVVYDKAESDKVLVHSNWCRPIIETVGDYTRGVDEDIVIETENEKLKEVWKENHANTLIHELAYGAGINGKTFLRIRQKEDKTINLFQVDPTSVYEVFDSISGDRESVVYFYRIPAEEAGRKFPEINIKEREVFYCEEWTDEEMHRYIDGVEVQGDKFLNPYGFIPFIEIPANLYRDSDISDVIPLNDHLNITLTFINEITKYQAFPLLAPKGTFNAETPALSQEQLRDVEISPRTIMPIPMERIASGEIPSSLLEHINQVERDISIVSGVPIKLLTAEIDGNTSGVAVQRMMSSVLKQAEIRRDLLRKAVREANNLILGLLGAGEEETDIVFPEMVAADLGAKLDEAIKKQTIGISRKTIIEELGYDFDEETTQKESELEEQLTRLKNEQEALGGDSQQQPEKGDKTSKGGFNKPSSAPQSNKRNLNR